MLNQALAYAAYGWHVFPCAAGTKIPCIPEGYLQATTDPAQITAWWSMFPNANIGINLAKSGLVAIDIDQYKPDCEWSSLGHTVPATYTQLSARGGLHYVFTAPPGAEYPGKLCRGVEIKRNGYIMLAPSIFEDKPYTVLDASAPVTCPAWVPLRDAVELEPDRSLMFDDPADIQVCLDAIPNDEADWDQWSRMAGAICNAGGTFEQFDAWSRRCPQYDERETANKWRQVTRSPYRDIGAGTLVELARKASPGFQRPSRVAAVFGDGAQPMPGAVDEVQPVVRAGWQYLDVAAQLQHFEGCVYVSDVHRVLMPNGALLKPDQFKVMRGGYEFQMSPDNSKPTKNAFEAFTESRVTSFPKADTMCFRPDLEPGEIVLNGNMTSVNTYVPAVIHTSNGDVTPFLTLLGKLIPDPGDQAIMLAYLAALKQYPGVKFRWCPLIQGVEGNGKGALMMIAEYLVGERYTHKPSAANLSESGLKFNGWMARKLLIVIEEIHVSDRRELLDALKPLITDDRVEFQGKGMDQVTAENRANFILTSNHRDAIVKTRNDRRYAIFYTAQQENADIARDGMTGDYLPKFYEWLRGSGLGDIAGYMERYDIPDELNPATRCHRAPVTSSTEEAINESRGLVEQEILNAVAEGRPGFCGGWISSIAVSRLLNDLHRTVPPRKRGMLMASLCYVPHPAFPNGQCTRAIFQEDSKRPVLYVQQESLNTNFTTGEEAYHAYMKAQGYAGSGVGVATL